MVEAAVEIIFKALHGSPISACLQCQSGSEAATRQAEHPHHSSMADQHATSTCVPPPQAVKKPTNESEDDQGPDAEMREQPPAPTPVPTPAEVIQNLVGRCYPDLPPPQPPRPPDDLPDLPTIVNIDPIICFVQNELGLELPGIEYGSNIIIKWPTPDDPDGPWLGGGGDDCERVMKLRIRGKVEDMGNGYWKVIGSDPI